MTPKLRIVKVIYQTFLPHQGRFPRVSGQAKMLQEIGHDVVVLACDREATNPAQEVIDGIPVERIRVPTGEMLGPFRQLLPLLIFYWKAFRWLLRRRFDMLQCHNLDVVPLGWLVGKLKRVTVIFDAHEPNYYALWPDRWRFMVRVMESIDLFFSRRVDAVTVTNQYQVSKYRNARVKRVELIGNYASPDLRAPEGEERTPSEAPFMFGRFGTFYPDVGLEETLEAIGRVARKYPEVRFLAAGRVVDAYRERFEAALRPVASHVVYTGPYDSSEMPRLYRQIRVACLIYPKSDWFRNITPRKFFDSLTNGVPVLMTDIGGLGEVIRRHRCGIVVDERNLDGICEAMERLASDPDLVREMAANALALARTEYSWSALVGTYARLLEEIHGA